MDGSRNSFAHITWPWQINWKFQRQNQVAYCKHHVEFLFIIFTFSFVSSLRPVWLDDTTTPGPANYFIYSVYSIFRLLLSIFKKWWNISCFSLLFFFGWRVPDLYDATYAIRQPKLLGENELTLSALDGLFNLARQSFHHSLFVLNVVFLSFPCLRSLFHFYFLTLRWRYVEGSK